MDCKELREILDLYVDNELSAEAAAAAGLHLNECGPCCSARDELLRLRQAIKEAVSKHQPPSSLLQSVRRISSPPSRRAALASLIVVILALGTFGALERVSGVRASVASAMEQVAFHLDRPHMVMVEGTIVCRERALHALYGSRDTRDIEGYHGALMMASGKLWNFMESEKAYALIHDESLVGKRVRIRAKVYRRADCLEVESYDVL
jgi:Putative zinc-finger